MVARLRAPRVARDLLEHDLLVLRVRLHGERAGADELPGAAVLDAQVGRGRGEEAERERRRRLEELRARLREVHREGLRVGDGRALVADEVLRPERRRRAERDDRVEVRLHRLGVDRRAVGVRRVVAQVERVARRVVVHLPALREPRQDLARLRVLRRERRDRLAGRRDGVVVADLLRVDAVRVDGEGERQVAARHRLAGRAGRPAVVGRAGAAARARAEQEARRGGRRGDGQGPASVRCGDHVVLLSSVPAEDRRSSGAGGRPCRAQGRRGGEPTGCRAYRAVGAARSGRSRSTPSRRRVAGQRAGPAC